MKFRKSDHITFVGSAVVVFLCTNAVAQEGHFGLGHDKCMRVSTRHSKEMTGVHAAI